MDVIDLSAQGYAFGDLTIVDTGTGTLITTPDGTIFLTAIGAGTIDAADFIL